MLFCPKCGSLMYAKEEKGKKYFACSCGYSDKKNTVAGTKILKEVVKDVKGEKMEVISENDTTLPLTEERCPKCKHPRAFWWSKQTRASDEPETRFFKCEKCNSTWRDRS